MADEKLVDYTGGSSPYLNKPTLTISNRLKNHFKISNEYQWIYNLQNELSLTIDATRFDYVGFIQISLKKAWIPAISQFINNFCAVIYECSYNWDIFKYQNWESHLVVIYWTDLFSMEIHPLSRVTGKCSNDQTDDLLLAFS